MHVRQSRMVAITTLLTFAAVANSTALLRPHNAADLQPTIVQRALEERDFFSDLTSFFSSLLAGTTSSTASKITKSKTAVSGKPASTGIIVTANTLSRISPTGTVSVTAVVKPGSSAASGTVASSIQPASSVKAASSAVSGTARSSGKLSSSRPSSGSVYLSRPSSTLPSKATVKSSTISTATASSSGATSVVAANPSGPTVSASAGTFIGASWDSVDSFINIPYAQPPVGPLRLKPPQPLTTSLGIYSATTPPNACPQIATQLTGNYSAGGIQPFFDKFVFAATTQSEDCLTINVFRPNTTTTGAKLPIVYWIYGGGFQFGSTSMYNGTNIVKQSVSLGAPIILVEVNYRLGGFGFLHGADLAAEHSTNLGLRDQRLGLQWVADNIDSFGGDSSKVTLWGESAGSISSAYQLAVQRGDNTYKGKPLFRASIHNSGAFAPADNGTAPQAQAIYDTIVSKSGCSVPTAAERLSCLRSVDYATIYNATLAYPGFGSYSSADTPYLPRTDDNDPFYNFSTEFAVSAGYWTKTPFIIGDQEDEGTLLAIVQNNITTNDELITYIASWFPNNPNAISDVTGLAALYPDDPSGGQPAGSPYGTSSDNNLYPQYKRLASILGDIVFIISRRAFLNFATNQGVSGWSYIAQYLKGLPNFGTLHGADLAYLFDPAFVNLYPTKSIQTHYISFINYLDPNMINSTETTTFWPGYNSSTPMLAQFGAGDVSIGNDTFRNDVYNYLVIHVFGFRV